MSRNLLVRIAVAVPAIAGAVAALWLGGWVLAAAIAVLGVLGTNEVYAFAKKQGVEPLEWVGFVAALAFPFATYWAKDYADWEPVVYGGAAWLLVALVVAAARGPERHPLTALAVTSFGPLYASALLAFLVAIRHGPHADAHPRGSVALAVMPLVITWVCDTCAMAAGALVGGPKLAPVLSPRKTWAGAIGGVVGGVLAALVYGPLVLERVALRLELWQLVTVGLVVAVAAQTAHSNAELLERQVAEWKPGYVGIVNGGMREAAGGMRSGPECLVEAATRPDVGIVVNGIVGAAGLEATLAALAAGKRVALANKESLVMAGELQHPTWRMGRKITVDSATLVNKALEVIEAHYLFAVAYEQVKVVVHPQSLVHAFVEFVDGSVLAQVGFPSMEVPILYALTHPERVPDEGTRRFDPVAAETLTFEPVRHELYPAYQLGRDAARAGGTAPAAFNAANEVAVQRFLDGQIRFGQIATIIEAVLAARPGEGGGVGDAHSLEAVL